MRDMWILQSVDWISMWKIYSSMFIEMFLLIGVALRFSMSRRLGIATPNKMWIVSTVFSVVIAYGAVFAALPGCALVWLLGGRRCVESFLAVLPIAASIGAVGAVLDIALIAFLCGEVNARRARLSYIVNSADAVLAIGIVLIQYAVVPPQVIALL